MCRDQPRGHPSTLGLKTLYELASLKYCYIGEREGEGSRKLRNYAVYYLSLSLSLWLISSRLRDALTTTTATERAAAPLSSPSQL